MPTSRRLPPTPALDALSGTEHARILAQLLTSHPELRSKAEGASRRLFDDASVDAIAEKCLLGAGGTPTRRARNALRTHPRPGYVHETDAAWESSKKPSSLSSPTCEGAPAWAWMPLWTSRQG